MLLADIPNVEGATDAVSYLVSRKGSHADIKRHLVQAE